MNSSFALRILSQALSKELEQATLQDVYKQTKQSVIFEFERKSNSPFFIEAFFSNDECLLNFPQEQARSRKAVSLLKELRGLAVKSVEQAENERTFVIHFEQSWSIVFKWFGRQSNILLWTKGKVTWMLRNKLENDLDYDQASLHKIRTWSEEEFLEKGEDLFSFIPQLGKDTIKEWINYTHWEELTHPQDRWLKVKALLGYLHDPVFYVIQENKRARFSLFPFKGKDALTVVEEKDPLKAANAYFQAYYRYNRVEALRERLLHFFSSREIGLSKQIAQLSEKTIAFDNAIPPQQLADIIMANLTVFQQQKQAEVLNFYTNEQLVVKIKDNMSAVDYAGSLYKKSKNRQTEKNKMLARLKQLEDTRAQLAEVAKTLEAAEARTLLQLGEKYLPVSVETKKSSVAAEGPEFKEYEFQGFKIYVGRNAKNNDELTLRFAHKEDLWLHARDVSGSHVIIKHKVNQPVFPKPVIEKAAQLAAFYSKRKTDSLCPVMYTLKKYVRKVKGAAPGQVRVEKESSILVVPEESLVVKG